MNTERKYRRRNGVARRKIAGNRFSRRETYQLVELCA